MGLREDKKHATRTAIADAALGLFLDQGFDAVTVADVARAAHVSVNTVFNYFATKEDLFLDRQDEVIRRLADAVTTRHPGEPAAHAVRRAFLDAVHRDDPTLGLDPGAPAFWRVIDDSPALQARVRHLQERAEDALRAALASTTGADPDDPMPALAAAILSGIWRALHAEIRRRITAGHDPAQVRTAILAAAARGFDAAECGLVGYAG